MHRMTGYQADQEASLAAQIRGEQAEEDLLRQFFGLATSCLRSNTPPWSQQLIACCLHRLMQDQADEEASLAAQIRGEQAEEDLLSLMSSSLQHKPPS